LYGVIPVEESGVTEYCHNGVDCCMWVDGRVGPGGDDLLDCVADYDAGDVAGWFV